MNSQTNPVIVMNTIKSMQQQIKILTERISRLSPSTAEAEGGGGGLNKITFEIEVYQDSEGNPYYYSPLSLSERANLFSKMTGRDLCATGYVTYGAEAPYTVYTIPSGVYRYFGDGGLDNASMIVVDDQGSVGQWTFFDRDNTFKDKTYSAGDAVMKVPGDDNGDSFVTTEPPGEGSTKVSTLIFDFYT